MELQAAAVEAEAAAGEDFFAANLKAFKIHAPHLHKRLAAIETPHSQLVVDPDGSIDMAFLGKRFYGQDAVTFAREQLDAYLEAPNRFTLQRPDPEHLGGISAQFCHDLNELLEAHGIACDPRHLPKASHFLIVLGIGLGFHVKPLIEATEAQVICLVEPNLEVLYHSLRVVDWCEIFDLVEREERKIALVVEQSPETINLKLRPVLRGNVPTFLDGIYLYQHYQSSILDQARKRIRDDMYVILAGLGFVEDELRMTTNAVENLRAERVELLCNYHPPKDVPVLIIGSGPSLENDIDFVLAHADRAMIFSIGTALRILLSHGLKPDYHFEIENGEGNPKLIASTAAEFDLSGITLVASATVHPRLPTFFDRVVLFFRENVSSSKIFAGGLPILQPAGPTVANTATISAIRMGFRELYLFGVDMGSRIEDKFHAEGSLYALGTFADLTQVKSRFPGNFGGEVFGEKVFNWSRLTLESVFRAHGNVVAYNCSDGARIAGTIPKVSREIGLTGAPLDREQLKQEVSRYLTVLSAGEIRSRWDGRAARGELAEVLAEIEGFLGRIVKNPDEAPKRFEDIGRLVYRAGFTRPVPIAYLAGTLLTLIGTTRWYDQRIADADEALRFRSAIAHQLIGIIAELRTELLALYDRVDARLAAAA